MNIITTLYTRTPTTGWTKKRLTTTDTRNKRFHLRVMRRNRFIQRINKTNMVIRMTIKSRRTFRKIRRWDKWCALRASNFHHFRYGLWFWFLRNVKFRQVILASHRSKFCMFAFNRKSWKFRINSRRLRSNWGIRSLDNRRLDVFSTSIIRGKFLVLYPLSIWF